MKAVGKVLILTLAISGLIAGGVAFAKTPHVGQATRFHGGKRPERAGVVPFGAPKKYQVVSSATLSAPDATQTRGTVACPAGTVVFGGGAFVSSGSTAANINSSIPSGNGWLADINNASGSATTFVVYAVCAKQPLTGYSIQTASVDNPAGSQSTAVANCPAHSKVVGGGGFSSSGSTSVNINTTIPIGKKSWRVDMNNATGSDASATAYAVCGKAKGLQVIIGTGVTNPAGTQTGATAACPAPQVPLSGGMFSSSGSTSVNVNTTYPVSGGWQSYENNASAGSATLTPYVVCAGT